MSNKLLITGGAGFIGVNVARHFLKRGWNVTLFDNFSRKGANTNAKELLAEQKTGVTVIPGDVRTDNDKLAELAETHDAVIHLAGQVAVTHSVANPRHDFENNVVGTFNTLEAIRQSKNKPPLIYASTNKVYGGMEDVPVKEVATRYEFATNPHRTHGTPESQPVDFHSPYGCSKGAAEQYVTDYARIYGLRTVAFRQSCIYGPHQFGVEDQGWVAWFSIAAMLGKSLTVYGNGKQVRDLLHAEDLSGLYEKALSKIDLIKGRAYNIGGGPSNTLSLQELLKYLQDERGYAKKITYAKSRPGDQPIFVADVRLAEKELGWKPAISVSDGLNSMHDWIYKNKEEIKRFFA